VRNCHGGSTPPKNRLIESLKMTCPVRAASSTGRRNTIQCIDSAMLLRKNQPFCITWTKPSQSSVSAGLTLASDSGFCFQCKGGSSLVLRRPIKIARVIGNLKFHIGD
jgi:hypothetical protein